jgi:hypothetical protein
LSSIARTESRDGNRLLESAAATMTATAIPIAPHNNCLRVVAEAARITRATAPQMKNQIVTNVNDCLKASSNASLRMNRRMDWS